jgi:hypothetical protein
MRGPSNAVIFQNAIDKGKLLRANGAAGPLTPCMNLKKLRVDLDCIVPNMTLGKSGFTVVNSHFVWAQSN